jgi:tRNA 5-methylaminomethyl-2-thiouridine biosynthesis bifunctional protein
MGEPVEWGDDGTPRSSRFDDIYRPAQGGLQQARAAFLDGCGLPAAWAGQPQWRILETGFGLGLNFLATWRAWQHDAQRPAMLHYVGIEAWPVSREDLLRSAAAFPELQALAQTLAQQWWGLVTGFHRLSFDNGRVLLTLCIGDVQPMLHELAFRADSVYLDGFEPLRNPAMWSPATFKGVARLCRRGTGIATWSASGEVRRSLQGCGFRIEKVAGFVPKRHRLQGSYDPGWTVSRLADPAPVSPSECVVVGAGLAGAAAAAALARRGWQVQVLDRETQPAAAASSLPAGLMAPYQSPDDNLLSRLTRSGIRLTLQQAQALLQQGADWEPTGSLELRADDPRPPPDLGPFGAAWTCGASTQQKADAWIDDAAHAWWHSAAAWIKPRALVRAWLSQASIRWRGGVRVERLQRDGEQWALLDAEGRRLARAPVVVLAAAGDVVRLLDGRIALTPVRGQLSWGLRGNDESAPWPAFPLNGNGHLLPAIPFDGGKAWLAGSSYGRGDADTEPRTADHEANLQRLSALVPALAGHLRPAFEAGAVRAWTGTRWASADRRPLAGWLEDGLGVSTAMGSRGLSFAVLCAETLAAQLHAEPLPVPRRLAASLAAARQPRTT